MSVTLLDLRNRHAEMPARPNGRILVLDETDIMVKHVDIYQKLIGESTVSGLICVALPAPVGRTGDEHRADPGTLHDGVALSAPAPLRPDGERRSAVLWVGDSSGLRWAPHQVPRYDEVDRPAADQLIEALQIEEVFDAALDAAADMPGAVANPGIWLTWAPAGTSALGEAAAAAAASLCATSGGASRTLGVAVRALDAEHDPPGAVLGPPVAAHARDAQRHLTRVTEIVRGLGSAWALFGSDRPTATVGGAVRSSVRAAGDYRSDVERLLYDMDGHIEENRPSMGEVVARGVAEPRPARGREILDGLRRLVGERLGLGTTLPDLAQELHAASAFSAPQGVSALHERVRRLSLPSGELPPFPSRPLSLWTSPLSLLSCLALVSLAGPGPDGLPLGLLLGLVWTMTGWLLLARRPEPAGERGFGRSAGPAAALYAVPALAGVAGGYVLSRTVTELPRIPYPMVMFGVFVVLAFALMVAGWRAAARKWVTALPVSQLHAAVTALNETTMNACVQEWQPSRRRRTIAAVAGAAASGVETLRQTLGDAAARDLLVAESPERIRLDRMPAMAFPELVQVVRGDLVDLCRTALGPVWSATESPRGSADGDVGREFQRLLEAYRDHVERHGVMSPFGPDADLTLRDALMMRAWTGSPEARDALNSRPSDVMVQLCTTGHLGFLSSSAEPYLIRFAPQRLRDVLRRDPMDQRIADDPRIVWTRSSEYAGVLRLVPMRPESVRHEWDGGHL
jgi:hypothetical protein